MVGISVKIFDGRDLTCIHSYSWSQHFFYVLFTHPILSFELSSIVFFYVPVFSPLFQFPYFVLERSIVSCFVRSHPLFPQLPQGGFGNLIMPFVSIGSVCFSRNHISRISLVFAFFFAPLSGKFMCGYYYNHMMLPWWKCDRKFSWYSEQGERTFILTRWETKGTYLV